MLGKVYSESQRDETFITFQERNIQNLGITELSYISETMAFWHYISLIFQEVTFGALKMKKLFIF